LKVVLDTNVYISAIPTHIIIECAVFSNATYIVTGDKRHLLPIKEYKGIKIVSPIEFLRL